MIIDRFPVVGSFHFQRKVIEVVVMLVLLEVVFEGLFIATISWLGMEYAWSMFFVQYRFWVKRVILGLYIAIKLKGNVRIAPFIGVLAITDAVTGALFYLLTIVILRTENE